MPKLGGATANDSVFLLGMHRLLLLADGLGAAEIAAALDPLPLAADRGQSNLVEAGDPYSDTDRLLRLTVGLDVEAAPARSQRAVLSLARLPHVTLDVLPDLKGLAVSDSLGSVAMDRGEEGISVTTTRRLGTTHFGWYRDDYAEILAGQTGLEQGLAVQLALSVAAHRALHNDYLVSPALAALRDTKAFWGRSTSSTTIEEAMFLAGLKSRIYRNVPIVVSSLGSMSITTGWLYDAAAMRLSGPLRKALAGALSPDATSEERGCVDHLLAIRSRLRDLIICRDELARLERREALGKDWPTGMRDRDSVIGGSGNDLVFRVDYHVTAALNAMSSILDNLAWIVCSREGLAVPSKQIGFDRIVDPRRPFGPTKASAWLAAAAQHDKLVREGLALRALRNLADHWAGMDYGWVMSGHPGQPAARGPEMLAVWIPRDEPTYGMPDGTHSPAGDDLAAFAAIAFPDLLVIRPRTLVEAALVRASYLSSRLLALYSWPPRTWLYRDPAYRQEEQTIRHCRGRWHRALWGSDLLPASTRG